MAEGSTRTDVRPSEAGVEVESDDADRGSEIVLIWWPQAVAVARRIFELARSRGDLT